MVVTRRAPAAPPSRTPSTQAAPRTASVRGQNASKLKETETNGDLDDTSPKKFRREKPKAKKGKGKKKKSRSLTDVLMKWLLLVFTIYSLSVCPNDDKLQSPVCRGLHVYRKLVLEAYVIPAFHRVLENPSVAPYVEKAQPYTDKAVAFAKRADDTFHTQVVPAFNAHVVPVWNERVVPVWDAHVVPQWNAHVVPQYEQHVAPHITKAQAAAAPYYSTASEKYATAQKIYTSHVDPYARQAGAALNKAQQAATPYAHLAAQKSYEGYLRARPYAGPAWIKFKQLCLDVLALLRAQRRRYVDPHVAQIWNKVVELSQGTPGPSASTSEKQSTAAKPVPPAEAVVAPAIMKEEVVPEPVPEVEPVVDATPTASSTATSSTPAPAVIEVEEIDQPVLSSAVNAATETASALSSTVAQSASTLASVASESASTLASTASKSGSSLASVASNSATSLSSAAVKFTPSPEVIDVVAPIVAVVESVEEAAKPVVEKVEEIAEPVVEKAEEIAEPVLETAQEVFEPVVEKVTSATKAASSAAPLATVTSEASTASASVTAVTDSVLSAAAAASESASSVAAAATGSAKRVTKDAADLDLDAFYAELGLEEDENATATIAEQPEETLTPEQIAEREEQRKAHIAAKRANIQARHAVWEEQLDALVHEKREAVRKGLVAGRKTAVAEFKSDEGIKGSVDGLVEEAERFLAGAEAYLKNLKKEEGSGDKGAVWSKVLNKIDEKFSKRLAETEGAVNGWWDAHNAREERGVRDQAEEIKDLAEQAQSDVGLDYVWLEDVTYNDWQRYHDLIRRYEHFLEDALMVQNGTHDSPPANPVETALVDLEAEVKDIVTGFETRLRQLRRSGARTFSSAKDEEDEEDKEADDELTEKEEELLEEPDMVNILPIPEEEPHPEAIRAPDVPVVGRGKEEVEQAFARANEVEEAVVADAAAAVHEEL